MSATTGLISGLREEIKQENIRFKIKKDIVALSMTLYVALSPFCTYKQAVWSGQMRKWIERLIWGKFKDSHIIWGFRVSDNNGK